MPKLTLGCEASDLLQVTQEEGFVLLRQHGWDLLRLQECSLLTFALCTWQIFPDALWLYQVISSYCTSIFCGFLCLDAPGTGWVVIDSEYVAIQLCREIHRGSGGLVWQWPEGAASMWSQHCEVRVTSSIFQSGRLDLELCSTSPTYDDIWQIHTVIIQYNYIYSVAWYTKPPWAPIQNSWVIWKVLASKVVNSWFPIYSRLTVSRPVLVANIFQLCCCQSYVKGLQGNRRSQSVPNPLFAYLAQLPQFWLEVNKA